MDVYPFSARSSREGDRLGCQGLVLQTPGLCFRRALANFHSLDG